MGKYPKVSRGVVANEPLSLGRFWLDAPLAQGGFNEVWRARCHGSEQVVVLKVLAPSRPATSRARAALEQEVHAAASLRHEHIVTIYDSGLLPLKLPEALSSWHPGAPYLVMEYAAGGSLQQIERALTWPQQRALLLTVLKALGHAHSREVIHRDLKPGNILLRQGLGAIEDVILSDFGLSYARRAHMTSEPDNSSRHELIGTPAYMAPEQIQYELRWLGPWTDLYALGCLAWELLHGQPPFASEDRAELLRAHVHEPLPPWAPRVEVPDGLQTWTRSMLAKSPHDRFAFAADAARALEALEATDRRVALGLSHHERSLPLPERAAPRGLGLGLYELREPPFVGREAPRHALWRALERVIAEQQPRMITLRGDAGVGKSRLARWLIERAHERGAASSLIAFHEPNPQGMRVTRSLLDRELRVVGLTRHQTAQRVRAYLERHRLIDDTEQILAQDVRVFTWWTHLEARQQQRAAPGRHAVPVTDEPSWRERQITWARLLRRITQRRALILWIDDIHWANDLIAMAEVALRQGRRDRMPVLIIATRRDDALMPGSFHAEQLERLERRAEDQMTTLDLGALEPEASRDLIEGMLPLKRPLTEAVLERCEGNPLWIVQLIGDWVEQGALDAPPSARFELERPDPARAWPRDLSSLWRRRLARFVQEEQGEGLEGATAHQLGVALQAAAVLGRDVMSEELEALLVRLELPCPVRLRSRLIARRLALPTAADGGWCFYHAMLREELLALAKRQGRYAALHAAAADAVAADRDAEQAPRHAERLAYHEIEAGRDERALKPLLTSLRRFGELREFYRARHTVMLWDEALGRLAAQGIEPEIEFEGVIAIATLHAHQGRLSSAKEGLKRARQLEPRLSSGRQAWSSAALIRCEAEIAACCEGLNEA